MNYVRPKKHLGQHFLKDYNIAQKIVESLKCDCTENVLEIGAGTGVLTQFLLKNSRFKTSVIEIDRESVKYLHEHFPELIGRVYEESILGFDYGKVSQNKISVIGNFPYNISSQIFFDILQNKEQIHEVVCMIQKEVAQRISSKEGSKEYGILSVLLQAFYTIEYLFTVNENVFVPPPKVKSGVIRLTRHENYTINNENLFKKVIKTAFNQRRKMLSNSISSIIDYKQKPFPFKEKRPEQLSVIQFIELTDFIEKELHSKN
jgi:16S rRNA (adenine1518-N6/adenine1519-N6)-dimethyltransferase